MFLNFDEFWDLHKPLIKTDENGLPCDLENIEEICRSAWEEGVLCEKVRNYSIIDFLKKEVIHKSSFKNVLKRENRELRAKLKNVPKQKDSVRWHKAEDLPPPYNSVVSIDVLTDTEEIAYYDYKIEEWVRAYSDTTIDTPNAWCKIPKYEDKLYE